MTAFVTIPDLSADPVSVLALDCWVAGGDPQAFVCWSHLNKVSLSDSKSAGSLAPNNTAVNEVLFHVRLLIPVALLAQLLGPVWHSHPRAPAPGAALALSPSMRVALESLRRCPFSGPSRELFVTARRNDLLLGFVELVNQRLGSAGPWVNRAHEARILEASSLLEHNLEHAPSLEDLARKVGLSVSSLKRGFREYFGNSVFGHLRQLRVRKARALLEKGEATVLEASLRVGYCNPSNFAAAFRSEFGVNPKEFQLSLRALRPRV